MNGVFRPEFCTVKAILGRRQPGLISKYISKYTNKQTNKQTDKCKNHFTPTFTNVIIK